MARSSQGKRSAILLLAAAVSFVIVPAPVSAAGPACATPGRDGAGSITGVVNTYYPGSATAAAGATTITLGAATGAAAPIAVGDLVLVIQMQDAAIDSTNTGAYGDGTAGDPATGSTALNAAGLYEYAVASSAVPLVGGSLTVSAGLINTYTRAAASAGQGARVFQVVRVPQYASATLTSGLTAAPFNGSTGGLLAIDVAAALTLNSAAVSVSQEGFRAGLGRQLTGAAGGTGTDYVNLSANAFHGQKGEGIAGTPQFVFDSRTGLTVSSGVETYPNGSTGRGAPGTAGGGGTDPNPTANDENTGGGGGANGGAGGKGGNSWNSNQPVGGFGGTAFPATAARVALGSGGGAGSRNNSGAIANASSGGNGGGIVLIRTGSVAGTASITTDGGTGVAPDNDGGGGGGAGGSVVVTTRTGNLGGLTVNARGGAGSNAWPTGVSGTPAGANYHGPGGGGGGGVVLTTSAPGTVNLGGGANGTTTTDLAAFGATPGAAGTRATITAAQIPGAGSGADCSPDLTIAKSHTDPFVRGGTGTYNLTVDNIGGGASSGLVTVTDTIPAGLTPTAASGTGWACTIAAQTISCTRSDALAAGTSFPGIAIAVDVAQSAPASLTNSGSVAGGGEFVTTNDTASDPTTVVSRADIAITKVASSGSAAVGSTVTFTVTAQNLGPTDATGVQVTDQLPAGLSFVSASATSGTYASGTGVWDIGPLANGASVSLTLTATVTAAGSLTNTASKTAETETDPNLANDSASASVTGQAPDLTIAKSHAGAFIRGASGSYSLTVTNAGAVATSGNVTVDDTLPAGLTPSAAAGTGWTCTITGQAVSCSRSDILAATASYPAIIVTVSVAQNAAGSVTNVATVAGGNELNTANDSASDPTAVTSQADIGVAKIASSGSVSVGQPVTFTVTTVNAGPSDATGVQITDQLPAGLTFVSAVASAGTYTSATGIWNIGAMASGGSVTLTITATVTAPGSIVNSATKTAETESDPNSANDTASAAVNGQAPDLTIAKTHSDPLTRGATGTYNLLVTNVGPASTNGNVTVSDTLPAGLTPTAAAGPGWSCPIAAQVVTCSRGDVLAPSAAYPAISITVNVSLSATSPLTNTASVAGGGEFNLANDSSSDPTTITSVADVRASKTASSATVQVGSNVTYTITATNAGPSNASGVQFTDLLPAGLTFVSATPSTGTYVNGTGLWTIGGMASGSSATLTITATVSGTGVITNTVSKTAETESDPVPANDVSSTSITGQPTPALPGPPSSGMAPLALHDGPTPVWGLLLLGAVVLISLLGLAIRRRSFHILVAAAALTVGTLMTLAQPATPSLVAQRSAVAQRSTAISDVQLFGKDISTAKPVIAPAAALHAASGPITPTRIRIPALNIDTLVENVGVTRAGAMDVPANIWDAAWLSSGTRPGATGQAVIDGHLDSVGGSALFNELHRLAAGDRIYVSDATGAELTFQVTAQQVAPLNGFPTIRVFGPSKTQALNLITCAGKYDAAHRTYDHRLVVYTTLTS